MAREVWGTYSVRDHLGSQAFLADLMFYDRLVLPVPFEDEVDEWVKKKWNPARQAAFIDVLEQSKRVKTVPWALGTWDRAKAKGEAGSDAFRYTRTRLTEGLPGGIRGVNVVPTYANADEFVDELNLEYAETKVEPGAGQAIATMAMEFLVPKVEGVLEPEHLENILEHTSTRNHKKARDAFWHWQRDFFGDDVITDQDALDAAVEEMADLIEDLRKAFFWKKVKSRSQYLFLAGSVSLAMFGGPLTPVGFAGVALNIGQFGLGKVLDHHQENSNSSPAALFVPEKSELPFNRK